MKYLLSPLIAALLLAGRLPQAQAQTALSVDFFYDALEPHGEWIEVGDYGYCWHPREVTQEWRPYTNGTWAYTDAGWTWISDEPHGWATYHYGRWVDVDATGWVWVPNVEWGPAWVSWRRSETHVGWAPLPPEASFQRTVGLSTWVDSYYDIGPASYNFVEVRNLGAPRLATVILEPRRNITIINETRNITRITYVNNVIVNEGPEYEVVSRVSAQPIRRLRLERRVDLGTDIRTVRSEHFRPTVEGDALRVMAPILQPGSGAAPKRIARKLANVQVNRGWKNAGPPEQVEKLRMKVKAEAKPPAELPPEPKFETARQRASRDRQVIAGAEPKPAAEPGAATTADPAAPPATAGKPPMKDREKTPGVAGRPTVAQPGVEPTPADPATPDPAKAAVPPTDPNAPAGTARKPGAKGREKTPGVPGRAGVARPALDPTTADPATADPTTNPPADPANAPADRPGKAGQGRAGKAETATTPARGKKAPAPATTTPDEPAPDPGAPEGARVPGGARSKPQPGAAKRAARPATDAAPEPSSTPPAGAPPATEAADQPGKGRGNVDQPKSPRTQPRTAEESATPPNAPAERTKAGRPTPARPGAGRDGVAPRTGEAGKKRTVPKDPAEAPPAEPAPERQ